MRTTRAAKGQASLSFLLTFVALVAVIAVLFQAMSVMFRDAGTSISRLGLKEECAEKSAEYSIWRNGFLGIAYIRNPLMVQNQSTDFICNNGNLTWNEPVVGGMDAKSWE
jgi:uncharacterized protein (UPF0333 family)